MKKIFVLSCLFSLVILGGCTVPDEITITKNVPSDITVGDTFEFTVMINNADSVSHELRSIDIGTDFLEGIVITQAIPSTQEEYEIFGDHIFQFDTTLPSGTGTLITFQAKALKEGDFSSNLDVCINGDGSCLLNTIRVIASPADISQ